MGHSKENSILRSKKTQIEFKEEDVTINESQPRIISLPIQETENVSNLEADNIKGSREIENTVVVNAYITEVPTPVEEKTGIMRQVWSGMERMFRLIKSAFKKGFSWLVAKIKPTSQEEF